MIFGWRERFPLDAADRVDRAVELADRFDARRFLAEIPRELWERKKSRERYLSLLARLGESSELTVRLSDRRTDPEPDSPADGGYPEEFVAFVRTALDDLGSVVRSIELVYGQGDPGKWKWWIDPELRKMRSSLLPACADCRSRGIPVAVGGIGRGNLSWLDLLCRSGVLAESDAIGLTFYPEPSVVRRGSGYRSLLADVREILGTYGIGAQIWITGTGVSTGMRPETEQLRLLSEALQAPAERLYWDSLLDAAPDDGEGPAERDGSVRERGLVRIDGQPKLAGRILLRSGAEGAAAYSGLLEQGDRGRKEKPAAGFPADGRTRSRGERPVLITGGAGFIGTNLAARFLEDGVPVIVLDTFTRPGVEDNFRWLRGVCGSGLSLEAGDIRDRDVVREAVRNAGTVYHLSAQVAVTTSLDDPLTDLEVNGTGTLNLLEAVRMRSEPPALIFTSTNKVYGSLSDLPLARSRLRYAPVDGRTRRNGIGENRPLDFHSPYGCSKGVADQYVRDYARIFGIPTLVFRMSCIYGQHQLGTEDQGWVAHFILKALQGEEISIYGDGRQVRDILHVDDLVEAFLLARRRMDRLAGSVFNIGGGPDRTVSLLELLKMLERIVGERSSLSFSAWRQGDQRYYVSDIRSFERMSGWRPSVDVPTGIARLVTWLREHRLNERGNQPLREKAV